MKIALTYTGSNEKHNNYLQWLKADEDVDILKISAEDNNLAELSNCNALVLAGGIDTHPRFYYNQNTNYDNSPAKFDEKRDEFEIAAFKIAQEMEIPVLGICRGMQLVNCIFEGTLKQDLGEVLNNIHHADAKHDKTHDLRILPDSIIKNIANAEHAIINSAHHQAIDKLGKGLQVNCVADDGTIEGFEWADPLDKPFLLCVQWHPERMFKLQLENSTLSKNIRDKFIEEIKKSIDKVG
jgi:putative glutamine amidotransferase